MRIGITGLTGITFIRKQAMGDNYPFLPSKNPLSGIKTEHVDL